MEHSEFQTCCRRLAEALRRPAAGPTGGQLLVGVGEDGALFWKVGHGVGGQFTSVFAERVAFCPFCGREVAAALGGAAREAPEGEDEEVTRWRLQESHEVETVLAATAAGLPTQRIHLSE